MKRLIFVIVVLAMAAPIHSQVTKVGTTAAPFLTIDVGARAVGMGGSFVSVADDATAMFWNPAGIARLSTNEVTLNHTEWIAGINFNYAGGIFLLGEYGTVGVNFTSLSMGEMERTTELDPEGMGEYFSMGSLAFGVSYARNLTDRFSIGITGKYIQEHILHCSASGLAIDIGTLFTTQFKGLRIGANISNFGTKMQMTGSDLLVQHDIAPDMSGNNPNINANLSTGRWDLPLLLRVGVSMDVIEQANNLLTLSIDALHPNDNTESINLGAEYMFNEIFSLRGGYKSLFKKDTEEGPTIGAGLNWQITENTAVKVDYVYEVFGRLSNAQKLSCRINF